MWGYNSVLLSSVTCFVLSSGAIERNVLPFSLVNGAGRVDEPVEPDPGVSVTCGVDYRDDGRERGHRECVLPGLVVPGAETDAAQPRLHR